MKLIFIVGVGRSGTSLLQSMFSSNSRVTYLPETSFFRRYVVNGSLDSHSRRSGDQAVINTLASDKYIKRTGASAPSLLQGAQGRCRLLDLAVYQELLSQYSADTKDVVGDKDPRLIEWLPALSRAFVGRAHVFNMIRDPRDVLVSKKKAAWSRKGAVWKHIFANRVQLLLGRLNGKKAFGERYREIIYEDLIAHPDAVLKDLCNAVGIPFEDSMLSFGEAAKKLVSTDELSWKKETFGPLLNKNKEKWRSELSPREVRLTELCCSEAMAAGPYQPAELEQGLSLKDRLWVAAGALVIRMATGPYIIYRNLKVATACRKIEGSTVES